TSGSPYVGCGVRTNGRTSGSRSGPACCAGTCSSRSCGACTPHRRVSRRFEHQRPFLLNFTITSKNAAGQKKTPGPRARGGPKNSAQARTGRHGREDQSVNAFPQTTPRRRMIAGGALASAVAQAGGLASLGLASIVIGRTLGAGGYGVFIV